MYPLHCKSKRDEKGAKREIEAGCVNLNLDYLNNRLDYLNNMLYPRTILYIAL